MRIGMLTYGMGKHLTGIGIYTRELCLALKRVHPNIDVVLINPYAKDRQRFFSCFENYHVPMLQRLPLLLSVGPVILPAIAKHLRLDLIHDPCGISPFWFPRSDRGARRVVTIHDAVPFVFPHVQPFLTRWTFHTYILPARRNTDAILTPSESSRQDLIRFLGLSHERVYVSYPGVISPSDDDIRQRKLNGKKVLKQWNLESPFFLYVGALNPRKNVPALISAFEQVLTQRPDAKLVLVGPNTWWADETLRAARRFQSSVFLTGYIEDEELTSLYAHASALVYPSIYEGFGLPPLEAMAYGTPVITSNVSSLPEVVGEAGIMVNPTDIQALSNAMLHVLHPDVSAVLSKRGRVRARNFSWDTTARDTWRVYETVMN